MAGLSTSNRYPAPPPSRGGALKWAFIGVAAAIFAPAFLKTCTPDKPPPPPEAALEPDAEPDRVPYYIAVATSQGSTGVKGAGNREEAQTLALELCEAHRRAREKKFTYIGAEECKIRGVASNFGGGSCISLSTNDTEYDYTPHVLTGPDDLLEIELRAYLTGKAGKYYNTRINPQAETEIHCVDFYGRKLAPRDVGYEFSRP